MKLEPNNKSLSFADFLEAALRDKADTKPFPYTLEVCRCRYCSYCQSGKCALKRCCCMSERVKAKSCTFAELLRDCFANFKDNVFQYRLRIACERASELQSCFLDAGHKGRFFEGVTLLRKKDPKFIAQIYLLSAYYDNVMIPECIGRTHPKGAITKRNRWMVEACDLFICYIEREDSGAYTAMKYAKKLEKKVINLAKSEEDQEDLLTTHI